MTARHTRTARRVATTAALSLLAAGAVAGPASGATHATVDARGDLAHGADLLRVHVTNEDRVTVRVKHEDLVRSWKSGSSLSVFLDTDPARAGAEFVFVGGTFEGSDYALLPAEGFRRSSDEQVPLNGGSYRMRLDYDRDVAVIRFDRAVLGDPGKVRVEVRTGGATGPSGTGGVDWLGKARTFAPWVPRG